MYKISLNTIPFGPISEGLKAADELRLCYIETGCILNGTPIWELNGSQIEDMRSMLIDSGKIIALMTIDARPDSLSIYRQAFRNAHLLNVLNIKIVLLNVQLPEQVDALKEIAKIGKSYGIRVLFENSRRTFLRNDEIMTAFYENFSGLDIGFIYNPLEFVARESHPFFHMFYHSHLKEEIEFLRLNDGLYSTAERVPLCKGNGEIKEMISILLARSYRGFFSLTPYIPGDKLEICRQALLEFRQILKEI